MLVAVVINRHLWTEQTGPKTCVSQSRQRVAVGGFRTALIGAISSAREDTVNKLKNITKLASLHLIEHEIIQIDNVLERIYELFPTDPQVRIFSARVSDALFELEQALHGMNVVDFTGKTRGQEAAS